MISKKPHKKPPACLFSGLALMLLLVLNGPQQPLVQDLTGARSSVTRNVMAAVSGNAAVAHFAGSAAYSKS